MNDQHRANLLLLAERLEQLPANYSHFNMTDFVIDADGDYVEAAEEPANITRKMIHSCGTCACAIGHAPTIRGLRARKGEDWDEYSTRIFGFDRYSRKFQFVFGADWGYTPGQDTAHAAAERLRHLAQTGEAPDHWRGRRGF